MSQIRIEARPVVGGVTGQGHLYLVYVDDTGSEFVIRGGPENNNIANFGDLELEINVPISESEDYRVVDDRELYGSAVLDLGGRDAGEVWSSMMDAAQVMSAAGIDYDAYFHNGIVAGANSNTTVAYVMAHAGISLDENMPNSPDGITSSDPYPGIEEIENVEDAIRSGIAEQFDAGQLTIESMIEMFNSVESSYLKGLISRGLRDAQERCFGPETPIDMWPLDPELAPDPDDPQRQFDQDAVRAGIWTKPIEQIEAGDIVASFDSSGNLVPGPVTRIFRNDAKILLDFHGTCVTPGHVYFRPDSKRSSKFETLIDVLRDDGVIMHQNGAVIRAATNVPVGTARDGYVQAVTGTRKADGTLVQKEVGRIRLGTRFLVGTGKARKSWAIADLIEAAGGLVGEDELIRVGEGPGIPFHWEFGDTLPNPEDFVLACSGTTLAEIYRIAEWESQGPRLPAPVVLDRGPVQPLSGAALNATARNEPLDVTHAGPNGASEGPASRAKRN